MTNDVRHRTHDRCARMEGLDTYNVSLRPMRKLENNGRRCKNVFSITRNYFRRCGLTLEIWRRTVLLAPNPRTGERALPECEEEACVSMSESVMLYERRGSSRCKKQWTKMQSNSKKLRSDQMAYFNNGKKIEFNTFLECIFLHFLLAWVLVRVVTYVDAY